MGEFVLMPFFLLMPTPTESLPIARPEGAKRGRVFALHQQTKQPDGLTPAQQRPP